MARNRDGRGLAALPFQRTIGGAVAELPRPKIGGGVELGTWLSTTDVDPKVDRAAAALDRWCARKGVTLDWPVVPTVDGDVVVFTEGRDRRPVARYQVKTSGRLVRLGDEEETMATRKQPPAFIPGSDDDPDGELNLDGIALEADLLAAALAGLAAPIQAGLRAQVLAAIDEAAAGLARLRDAVASLPPQGDH
jgi:hypothetical protein